MIMGNPDGLAAEMAVLQEKMATLQERLQTEDGGPKPPVPAERASRIAKHAIRAHARPKTQRRMGRVNIAPGINLTTMPGSMYSAMAKAAASLGALDRHDALFNTFLRNQNAASAKHLLNAIGAPRAEMDMYVRANDEFRDHCDDRTRQVKKMLATGSAKAKSKARGILNNPKICDGRGRWIGDLDEGVSILSGARTLKQVRKGKNLRILNKAALMFDTLAVGGNQLCFLYKQKWHRAFLRAVALVNP